MTNSLRPEQGRYFVCSDPGPYSLQMISADEKSAIYRQGLCQYKGVGALRGYFGPL